MKFYICKHCGNIITYVHDSGVKVVCCGEEMQELIAGTTDASTEKHIPVITVDGKNVHVVVGSIEHPMEEAHYIQWIVLETKNGHQRKNLSFNDKPMADFCICEGDEVVAAYEYCNLHGLWKA